MCALCFRNTGGKKSHPAAFCQMFPLPERKQFVSGEKGPSMADMGIRRGPFREVNAREDGKSIRIKHLLWLFINSLIEINKIISL